MLWWTQVSATVINRSRAGYKFLLDCVYGMTNNLLKHSFSVVFVKMWVNEARPNALNAKQTGGKKRRLNIYFSKHKNKFTHNANLFSMYYGLLLASGWYSSMLTSLPIFSTVTYELWEHYIQQHILWVCVDMRTRIRKVVTVLLNYAFYICQNQTPK